MKIDRTRFLLITGALAASTSLFGASMAGFSSTSATTTDAGPADDAGGGGPGTDGAASDGGGDANADASACLPSVAPANAGAIDCASEKLTLAGCNADCTTAATNYTYGVAAYVAGCLTVPHPTVEGCPLTACLEEAIPKACAESTAAGFCSPLIADCADAGSDAGVFTQNNCVAVSTALSSTGRDLLQSCIHEGGIPHNCGTDPSLCLDAIKQ